jgi:CTP synthase (UTP-ammonia lyase)
VTSGVGGDGEVRIIELPEDPFFLATLFVPQARSTAARPHPLLVAFVAAAAAHKPLKRHHNTSG